MVKEDQRDDSSNTATPPDLPEQPWFDDLIWPHMGFSLDIFSSEAPLEGVCKILPGYKTRRDKRCVSGLLLEYVDGSRKRLGEYRADDVAKALPITPSKEVLVLRHGSDYPSNWAQPILGVFISAKGGDWPSCHVIPMSGVLEWHFTYRDCCIRRRRPDALSSRQSSNGRI